MSGLTVRVGLRLPADVHKQLEQAARKEERTVSSLVRYLIRQHLEPPADVDETKPVSQGQLAALNARADELDRKRKHARGTSKQAAIKAAGAQFDHDFVSSKELTFLQCSWVLDYLRDQIEHAQEQEQP